jgi:hypothetical protein
VAQDVGPEFKPQYCKKKKKKARVESNLNKGISYMAMGKDHPRLKK